MATKRNLLLIQLVPPPTKEYACNLNECLQVFPTPQGLGYLATLQWFLQFPFCLHCVPLLLDEYTKKSVSHLLWDPLSKFDLFLLSFPLSLNLVRNSKCLDLNWFYKLQSSTSHRTLKGSTLQGEFRQIKAR